MRPRHHTEGYTTVLAVLGAAFLLMVVLGFTMTMALSSMRTTSDQSRTLSAQYAAESGLNHAIPKLKILNAMLQGNNLSLTGVSKTDLDAYVNSFCGGVPLTRSTFTPAERDAHMDNRYSGVQSCNAPANPSGIDRFDLLTDHMTRAGYKILLQYNNPAQSNAWLNEAAKQMAGEPNAFGTPWTAQQRRNWWNNFTSGSDIRSSKGVNFETTLRVRPYAVRTYQNGLSTISYRFLFKSELSSTGTGSDKDNLNSRRVMVASDPGDTQGISSFDINVWGPALFLDSARSQGGYAYSGNISNLLGVSGRDLNSCSTYNDDLSSGACNFAAQFRNGIYSQEEITGGIHTNEFLTFDEWDGSTAKTISGNVSSAGCIRNPDATRNEIQRLKFSASDCLRFEPDVFGREDTNELVRMFDLKNLVKQDVPSYDSLSDGEKAALLIKKLTTTQSKVENRWDGTDTKFLNKPNLTAPFIKVFDYKDEPSARYGLMDSDLVRRRNASRGLGNNGKPLLDNSIGLNVEDLYSKYTLEQLAPSYWPGDHRTIWQAAGGVSAPTVMNATVKLRPSSDIDINSGGHYVTPYEAFPKDTGDYTWDAARHRYTINGRFAKYQFIEITPNYTPSGPVNPVNPDSGCATPKPITIRVDSSGKMEIYVYKPVIKDFTMFTCDKVKDIAGAPGEWRSFMPGRKFNGNIYADGNIQLTQAMPDTSKNMNTTMYRRLGHDLDGGFENMFPAIASFQKIEVGAGKKIHIPRDLLLEQMPCTDGIGCPNTQLANSLSVHAADNVELSDEVLPVFYNPDGASGAIPAPILRNMTLASAIISSQGELTLKKNAVESGTSGTIFFLRDLNIIGTVMTKYNGQVGRYMPSTNDFRGYRRKIIIDPRIANGTWTPHIGTQSSQNTFMATNFLGNLVPSLEKAGY